MRRVLVAEDNPVSQRVAAAMLGHLGFTVDVADNGREAIEALARVPYVAVLMDCQMPVLDGYQASAEIRRRQGSGPRIPIIALTASALEGDGERCLAAGMDAYLSKPVKIPDLRQTLGRLLAVASPDADGHAVAAVAAVPAVPPVDDRVDEELLAELDLGAGGPSGGGAALVGLFVDETARRIDGLRRAVDEGDLHEAARLAHSLRGSSGAFGARRVSALGAELETACTGGHADRAALLALVATLEVEFDAFRAILSSRLNRPDQAP